MIFDSLVIPSFQGPDAESQNPAALPLHSPAAQYWVHSRWQDCVSNKPSLEGFFPRGQQEQKSRPTTWRL
ncbi:Gtpase Imap Family Member 8 [Manis pentadactyla]|nr:Gtpase Imap Family Member 8 [Manis pentadactyla]